MRSMHLVAMSALVGSLSLAQPAAAAILYDFGFTDLTYGYPDFTLHFESPIYITHGGMVTVLPQATPLGYSMQNWVANSVGWFLFSHSGGVLTEDSATYSNTTFLFRPDVPATAYFTAPGVHTGTVGGAAIGSGFSGQATLTITDSAPYGVPEPTVWVLMIVGFGLVGATLRRQTSAA